MITAIDAAGLVAGVSRARAKGFEMISENG